MSAWSRRSPLTVLHASRLPDQYDAAVGSPVLREEWLDESQVILSEILARRSVVVVPDRATRPQH